MLREDVKGEREFSQQWDMGSREQFRTDSPGAPRWKEGGAGSRGRARESGVMSEATAAWRGLHLWASEDDRGKRHGKIDYPEATVSYWFF